MDEKQWQDKADEVDARHAAERDGLEATILAARRNTDEVREERDALKADLVAAHKAHGMTVVKLDTMTRERDRLAAQLEAAQRTVRSYHETDAVMKAERDALKADLVEAHKAHGMTVAKLDTMRRERDDLHKSRSFWRNKADAFQSDRNTLDERNTALKVWVAALREKHGSAEADGRGEGGNSQETCPDCHGLPVAQALCRNCDGTGRSTIKEG
jgi:chromosome segregation ATPase